MVTPREDIPKDAPPTYAVATGSSTSSTQNKSSHLEVPGAKAGIPPAIRRSMEDEVRPLPVGWVRQWDAKEQHQFFVDTKASPPRSIWHHPYDDEDYLKTLSAEERERIQQDEMDMMKRRHNESTDDEAAASSSKHYNDPPLPARPDSKSTSKGKKDPLGRRLKDKLTGSTHEEREQERREREEEERQYYEAHAKFRQAMQRAQMTGQPQLLGKDRDGKDVYIEPPGMGAAGYGNYGNNGYGYNPYASGPYANPNARFIRPGNPYNRPYGGAYGGGYGYGRPGMGMPIAGGLLGGMLLGGLLF